MIDRDHRPIDRCSPGKLLAQPHGRMLCRELVPSHGNIERRIRTLTPKLSTISAQHSFDGLRNEQSQIESPLSSFDDSSL